MNETDRPPSLMTGLLVAVPLLIAANWAVVETRAAVFMDSGVAIFAIGWMAVFWTSVMATRPTHGDGRPRATWARNVAALIAVMSLVAIVVNGVQWLLFAAHIT